MSDIDNILQLFSLKHIQGYTYEYELDGGLAATTLLYSSEIEKIVIKILIMPRNEDELDSFKNEANALTHAIPMALTPRIKIPFTKVPELPIYYFGMEYVDGITLKSYIDTNPLPWEWEKALTVVTKIAVALRGSLLLMVHRDLHLGNILVVDEKKMTSSKLDLPDQGVRIIDLGCHKNLFLEAARAWKEIDPFRPFGAISTWPPEFFKNTTTISNKQDEWALGTILYKLLTNNYPVQGRNLGEIISKLLMEPLQIDTSAISAPYAIKALVCNLLHYDPSKRKPIIFITKLFRDIFETNLLSMKNDFIDHYIRHEGLFYVCLRCTYISAGNTAKCLKCGQVLMDETTKDVTDFTEADDPGRVLSLLQN